MYFQAIMRYGETKSFQTGVAIPVFGLRSAESVGIGEFLDLVPFAKWAKSTGMDLIQILPVNDTGEESSPYSARSAFALNPVHIRLQAVAGHEAFLEEIHESKERLNAGPRIDYLHCTRNKRQILAKIFHARKASLEKDKTLHKWINENTWVKPYAVYCMLKIKHAEASWKDWESHQKPTPSKIDALWAKHYDETLYHAWMQYEAEIQFRQAIAALDEMGVKLKGDVPILINEDSADVWAERKYFALEDRAGAPPDMFSYSGQNWGFPTYRWDILEKDDFNWWRRRLGQASKFYHAYRIDHVLGFFRIWTVPDSEVTGILGRFQPSLPISRDALAQAGFGDATLDYLCNPNFARTWIAEKFGDEGQRVLSTYFERLSMTNSERVLLRSKYRSEKVITQLDEPQSIKDSLLQVYWNRVFVPSSTGKEFWPFWYWYEAPVLHSLPDHEQKNLRRIIEANANAQEEIWRQTGLKLLKVMAEETDMLVCAEDLGVVPDCVPEVLKQLNILSLRIERWTRQWSEAGQPYIAANEYPRLSVCTTSCHDSSSLRGLWEEKDFDREFYWKHLGLEGNPPLRLGSGSVFKVLRHLLSCNSLLAIPPLQDLLALGDRWVPHDPAEERVNIPGTVGPHNWCWRMPCLIEDLQAADPLNGQILALVEERKARPLWTV